MMSEGSGSSLYSVVVDARDPKRLGEFWSEVLDQPIVFESDDGEEVAVARDTDTPPALLFVRNADAKAGKNRLHFDLNPTDQDAEVDRILALGATKADVGQTGQETWVVLADPEGNEFCVLTAR
jgi:predicted enzyme related to lactoylglutathione lyase